MIILRQTIAPPHFPDAVVAGLLSLADSRQADPLPVDDPQRESALAAAEQIEAWTQCLWWRSAAAGGGRAAVTLAQIAPTDCLDRLPAIPDRGDAVAAVDGVERWVRAADATTSWVPLAVAPAPVGWASDELGPGDVVRVRATATPADPPPGAIMEALRRLYGWRDQFRPIRGRRDEEPINLGAALRRSGALEVLAGAGYGDAAGL